MAVHGDSSEFDLSLLADGAVAQFAVVKAGTAVGNQQVCATWTSGQTPIGIAMQDAADGQMVPVRRLHEAKAIAGGSISAWQRLAVTTGGKLVLASGSDAYVVAIALQDAATNDIFRVLVSIYPYELYDMVADESTITTSGGTELSVKTGGVTPTQLSAAATEKDTIRIPIAGDIAASVAATLADIARGAGVITRAGFKLGNTGTDGSNPLSAELDVLINGATIFSTKPVLAKTAADGAVTVTAGTGVTVGVINAAADDVVNKDLITYALTLTRTTPEDEIADAFIFIDVAYKVGV